MLWHWGLTQCVKNIEEKQTIVYHNGKHAMRNTVCPASWALFMFFHIPVRVVQELTLALNQSFALRSLILHERYYMHVWAKSRNNTFSKIKTGQKAPRQQMDYCRWRVKRARMLECGQNVLNWPGEKNGSTGFTLAPHDLCDEEEGVCVLPDNEEEKP